MWRGFCCIKEILYQIHSPQHGEENSAGGNWEHEQEVSVPSTAVFNKVYQAENFHLVADDTPNTWEKTPAGISQNKHWWKSSCWAWLCRWRLQRCEAASISALNGRGQKWKDVSWSQLPSKWTPAEREQGIALLVIQGWRLYRSITFVMAGKPNL